MEQLSMLESQIKDKSNGIVLSASRMTDMPKFYHKELIKEVQVRIDKGMDIHTLVLWTKHPDALLKPELRDYLLKLKNMGTQIYLECTITGMGRMLIGEEDPIIMEPNVPNCKKAIRDLVEVINLLESPLRIKLRIDPIIRLKHTKTGEVFTNLRYANYILKETSKLGIKEYVFSFVETGIHQKVDNRFRKYDWKIVPPNIQEKKKVYDWLEAKAKIYDIQIKPCCVPGLEENRCIDGYRLQELHDDNKKVSLKEPRKRELCACTHSIDIGGWPPKRCYSGCKYCYANAEI